MRRHNPRFTEQGVRKLGQIIRAARQSKNWSIEYFASVIDFSEATTRRLEKGQIDRPQWDLVNAIASLGIVLNPRTNEPFTTDQLMLIACEWVDPSTGHLKEGGDEEVSAKLVELIQLKLKTDGISLEDLADICELSRETTRQLAQGIISGDPLPKLMTLAPNLYNPSTKRSFGDWELLADYLKIALPHRKVRL